MLKNQMKFKKIIKLNHHIFLLFEHQGNEFLYKFNSNATEKRIYKKCQDKNIMPDFLIYCNSLFIKYEAQFISLQEFLFYNRPIYCHETLVKNIIKNLHILHDNEIAWVDIKPNNILIHEKNNQILFIDFNYSKLKTHRKSIGRTFPFVPPEYLHYKKKLDFNDLILGDIFVIGMIICILLNENRLLLYDGKYIENHYEQFLKNLDYYQMKLDKFFGQKIYMLEYDRFKRKLPHF